MLILEGIYFDTVELIFLFSTLTDPSAFIVTDRVILDSMRMLVLLVAWKKLALDTDKLDRTSGYVIADNSTPITHADDSLY